MEKNESIFVPSVRAELYSNSHQSDYLPMKSMTDTTRPSYTYYRFVDVKNGREVIPGDKYYLVDEEFKFGLCKAYYRDKSKETCDFVDRSQGSYDFVDINGNVYSAETEKQILEDYLRKVESCKKEYIEAALSDKENAEVFLARLKEELLKLFANAITDVKQESIIRQIRNIH